MICIVFQTYRKILKMTDHDYHFEVPQEWSTSIWKHFLSVVFIIQYFN